MSGSGPVRVTSFVVLVLLKPSVALAQFPPSASSVVVRPTEYFAVACTGQQTGVAFDTGAAYRCSNGRWDRQDLPLCAPDPPSGPCTGNPTCQSKAGSTVYLCVESLWKALAVDLTIPLGLASGGTGGSTAEEARASLGAAADAAVVHIAGAEAITGSKAFLEMATRNLNGTRQSGGFPDIASAVADLPATGGAVQIDSTEDDATPFADTNPAAPNSGKLDSLIVDSRRGGIRFLSSMAEYPSGPAGRFEDRVPFIFQVRRDDTTRLWDSDAGAIGEWNCGRNIPGQVESWRNCPYDNDSWGIQGGSKQFWHSGQCNMPPSNHGGSYDLCGGPHILEVRFPEQPGIHESKPVFAVGSGGVSIYQPEDHDPSWRGFLTMFRADDGNYEPAKANTPMFSFERYGSFHDGNNFFGNTLNWPFHTQHSYPQFNLWVQQDIAPDPAFVVEGSEGTGPQYEQGVLARIYDKTCCPGTEHRFGQPNSMREAFGFYANSVLRLASFTTTTTIERGQYIEWEGRNVDSNATRLRVNEPTAPRDVHLPDASGTVLVAPNSGVSGPLLWGRASTGNVVCQEVGLTCQATAPVVGTGTIRPCDYAHPDYFQAMCLGSPP